MRAVGEHFNRSRARARRVALVILAQAFPGRLALIVALTLLTGTLPAIFAALVGRLVATLPAAVACGVHSTDGQRVIGTLITIAGALLFREVVTAASGLAETDLYQRYDEYLLARVMRATLAAPGLALFGDPSSPP